uniref:Elongator complex protein 6 n=1 Tax=Ornithodoros turicata TaxID=34597 RepID=A0A2R5LH31_9ACAR
MFLELNSFLDFDDAPSASRLIFVSSSDVPDHGFVLNHLLMLYLKTGRRVFQINFVNQETFYSNTCQRLGIRLTQYKEKKAYFNFDCMRLLKQYISDCGENTTHPFDFVCQKEGERNLEGLSSEIVKTVLDFQGQNPSDVLLVIDDLTILQTLGVPNSDMIRFLHLLRTRSNARIVVGAKWLEDDHSSSQLCCYLAHLANMCIRVQGLPTGYSSDIHGQISVMHRNEKMVEKSKKMHFRLEEKGVKLFPVGLHKVPMKI